MEKSELKDQDILRIFNITENGWKLILEQQVDMNCLFLLDCLFRNNSQDMVSTGDWNRSKVKAWRQTLIRKSWIDEENNVTELGKALLSSIQLDNGEYATIKTSRKEASKTGFDKWWEIFPSTDKFDYGGKKFPESRPLRLNKKKCKEKFEEMVNKGEYKAEEVIKATQFDIQIRKKAGLKKNENTLTYVHNSLTYLNQRDFEAYIGREIEEEKPKQSSNVVDI